MQKSIIGILLVISSLTVSADPTYMVGISYSFNGDVGVSAKVLSNDGQDEIVGVAGATYYPFSDDKFGIDLGTGYTFSNSTTTASWDFLKQSIQLSAGYADIEDEHIRNIPICSFGLTFNGISCS